MRKGLIRARVSGEREREGGVSRFDCVCVCVCVWEAPWDTDVRFTRSLICQQSWASFPATQNGLQYRAETPREGIHTDM